MKYVNQAPKELGAQSAKFKKKWATVEDLCNHGWAVQPKYDGVHAMIHTGSADQPEGRALSRTGEAYLSIDHLIKACQRAFGYNWVVFVEVWVTGWKHKDINGAARRQYPQPDLQAVVFDAVPQVSFDRGSYDDPYWERLDWVEFCISQFIDLIPPALVFPEDQVFTDGSVTTTALTYKNSEVDAYDGLILRDLSATWKAGASKEGEVIKVKPSLSLDLVVVGQHAEKRATKLGGYLTVEYNGVPSDVGSGLTQSMLQRIFNAQYAEHIITGVAYHVGDGSGEVFLGKIAEIECLGITPDGKLREPRFKGFRFDTVNEERK